MGTKTTLSRKFLTVDGVRAGIQIVSGPWVPGVPADLIKLRARKGFPANFRAALQVTNNSHGREDYFERDTIRLLPGHPLYATAASFVEAA